ncbi:MAG: 50S ribosomal protein L30 [Gammaproteobacteria bacterium]
MNKQLKVTLKRSLIGRSEKQRATITALGLRRLNKSKIVNNTPDVMGMISKVRFMLDVEEVK